jgi:hypothetical protein
MKLIVIAKMNSSPSSSASKSTHVNNKNKDGSDDIMTINEKINLTKQQHHVLKIMCDTYEIPFQNTCSKH